MVFGGDGVVAGLGVSLVVVWCLVVVVMVAGLH